MSPDFEPAPTPPMQWWHWALIAGAWAWPLLPVVPELLKWVRNWLRPARKYCLTWGCRAHRFGTWPTCKEHHTCGPFAVPCCSGCPTLVVVAGQEVA